MPPEAFGRFTAAVPPPLSIGSVRLADGRWVKGFLVEAEAVNGGRGISSFGGGGGVCGRGGGAPRPPNPPARAAPPRQPLRGTVPRQTRARTPPAPGGRVRR